MNDLHKRIEELTRPRWFHFLIPPEAPRFIESDSLKDANWKAAVYKSEAELMRRGRAMWAWVSLFLALVIVIMIAF